MCTFSFALSFDLLSLVYRLFSAEKLYWEKIIAHAIVKSSVLRGSAARSVTVLHVRVDNSVVALLIQFHNRLANRLFSAEKLYWEKIIAHAVVKSSVQRGSAARSVTVLHVRVDNSVVALLIQFTNRLANRLFSAEKLYWEKLITFHVN